MNPYLIGLTGGIGSGKSTAAELLARAGAGVIDTDAIAHALTAPGGAAMRSLIGEFGPAIATKNGALDRAVMREMAFADPTVRRRLEAILHPMIHAEVDRQIAALAPTFPYLVLVVPLLIETGTYRERIDRLAVVDCPEALQIARVRARSQLPEATFVQSLLLRPVGKRGLQLPTTSSTTARRFLPSLPNWKRFISAIWLRQRPSATNSASNDRFRISLDRRGAHLAAARSSVGAVVPLYRW